MEKLIKFFNKRGKRERTKGFTLAELLVALAVFTVVMTISLGAVITIIDSSRKTRNLKTVMTNMNFALEAMSRDIKFGHDYHCGISTSNPPPAQNCTGSGVPPGSAITFVNSTGIHVIYRLNGSSIEKSTDQGSTYSIVTAPGAVIDDLKFYVFGSAAGDNIQPRILILLRGHAGNQPSNQSSFVLQTTVSQRALDS